MFYHDNKFYDNDKEIKIVKRDLTFTYFSNGEKYITIEVELKIKSEKESKAIFIKNENYLNSFKSRRK